MHEPTSNQELKTAYVINSDIFYSGQNIVLPKNKMLEIKTNLLLPMRTIGIVLAEYLSKQQIFLSQSIFSCDIEHEYLTVKIYNLNNTDFILRTDQLLGRIVYF